MRGNLLLNHGSQDKVRSIPAYAGEPNAGAASYIGAKVYPRVCGGTSPAFIRSSIASGLSPRMRGNHFDQVVAGGIHRSIPAYAGEPLWG